MLSEWERATISSYVAEHNLPTVNARSAAVCPRESFYTKYGKRLLDIVLSLAACLVTFPINVVFGFLTYCDVGTPVFFKQKRPGRDGKPFTLIKFRNMTEEKDERGELLPIGERVTKFGSFMRKTSMDELLNFWSVLKGDMSLIGPRPLLPQYLGRYSDRHKARVAVRPGLECPNLKKGGYGEGWLGQFENDVWYVENESLTTDFKMLLCLVRMVFDKETREIHSTKGVGEFLGYDRNGVPFGQNNVPSEYMELIEDGEPEGWSVPDWWVMYG